MKSYLKALADMAWPIVVLITFIGLIKLLEFVSSL